MTSFFHDESGRLLAKLHDTDPTTPAYLTCLQGLEVLAHATWLDELAALHEDAPKAVIIPAPTTEAKVVVTKETPAVCEPEAAPTETTVSVSFTAAEEEPAADVPTKDPDYDIPDEPVQPDPVEEKPAKTYTKAEVRAALVAFRNGGGNIKSFLANFGADNFSNLDESKWAAVMEKLNA